MILQKLRIEIAPSYAKNAGQYEGLIEFSDGASGVHLKLTPAHCEKIFLICADGIFDTAKEAAASLTCNVIEHRKALEA